MKQYSSNGCNIFAFNILVKDGYDGILRQYEVLCTRDAVTCITCRCMWSSTVQVKSRYYHSYYNSFTAWPQRVTSSHLTFPCSHANDSLRWVAACKPEPRQWAFLVSLWWTKAKNKTKKHPKFKISAIPTGSSVLEICRWVLWGPLGSSCFVATRAQEVGSPLPVIESLDSPPLIGYTGSCQPCRHLILYQNVSPRSHFTTDMQYTDQINS